MRMKKQRAEPGRGGRGVTLFLRQDVENFLREYSMKEEVTMSRIANEAIEQYRDWVRGSGKAA